MHLNQTNEIIFTTKKSIPNNSFKNLTQNFTVIYCFLYVLSLNSIFGSTSTGFLTSNASATVTVN